MKNSKLFLIATVIMLSSMSACIIVEDDYDPIPPPPPCEYNSTGEVCFDNTTDLDMFLSTDGFEFSIPAFSTTCAQIPAGFYSFYADAGYYYTWKGGFDVFVCEQSNVFLDYKNQ